MSDGTRHLILGDTHGDLFWTLRVLDHAQALKIKTIFQVGDWGFLWPGRDQTQRLAAELRTRDQRMYFIDGNHDWHPKLRRRRKWPAELVYLRRGSVLTLQNDDGKEVRIGCLGGAPSIDKSQRVDGEDWWPEEEITHAEALKESVDIMLTHDAPVRPWNLAELQLSMTLVYKCNMSQARIQQSVHTAKPRILYHGHYHWPYQSTFENTLVRGLNCNRTIGAYIVVDHNFEEVTDRITGWVAP